ncbi:MAG: flagellar basal body L-ring protein FlgH [Methylovulum sp.]|nr:flagellar basal body L-ring protein FlgH [Methylovulum sp.]
MTTHKLKFIAVLLLPAACAQLPLQTQRDPAFAPVAPADLRAPAQNTGAIYQAGYDMRLFENHAAIRVGDILTVKLQEKTQAQKKADLNAKKDTSLTADAPVLLGMGASALLAGNGMETTLKSAHDFKGEGDSAQSNSLTGNIAVTVVEQLPNGNLKIRGEKIVNLNQGDEYIRLSGIVRPVDIDVSNTISSDNLADATITYTGSGAMADASKMGWLSRILTSPWFPF